jgi:hypothetical protein
MNRERNYCDDAKLPGIHNGCVPSNEQFNALLGGVVEPEFTFCGSNLTITCETTSLRSDTAMLRPN